MALSLCIEHHPVAHGYKLQKPWPSAVRELTVTNRTNPAATQSDASTTARYVAYTGTKCVISDI